jgi:sporulation protein YlmC with PRC-barrel domain
MFRKFLATTALATLVATGAFAQATTTPAPADPAAPATEAPAVTPADGFLATNMIGETVYNGTGEEAQNIGDVNDLVFDKDGKIKSIVIGAGGFLGVGEKSVELPYDKAEWAEKDGDRWIVVATTKEELDAMPAFDRKPYDPAPAPMATGSTETAPSATPAPMEPAPAEPAPVEPAPAQ